MFNLKRYLDFEQARLRKQLPFLALGLLLPLLALLLAGPERWSGMLTPPGLLFWLFVALIPLPLAAWLARQLTIRFISAFYGINRESAAEFLTHRWVGQRPSFLPFVMVKEGALAGGKPAPQKIGGPAGLVLYQYNAVVLEKAGQLTRVVAGPKFLELEAFEKVWAVIDLRPQRWVFSVSAITQDGIPIEYDADIQFQVGDAQDDSAAALEAAIFKAATCTWIRDAWRTEPDRFMDWPKRVVIGDTEGALRSILARFTLDQLIEPAQRELVRQQLETSLRSSVPRFGVKILNVALLNLKLQGKIVDSWLEAWRAERTRVMQTELAQGTMARTLALERARADVRREILHKTAETFKELAARYGEATPETMVILSCIEVIKRTAFDLNVFLPADILRTLETVRATIDDNGTDDDNGTKSTTTDDMISFAL